MQLIFLKYIQKAGTICGGTGTFFQELYRNYSKESSSTPFHLLVRADSFGTLQFRSSWNQKLSLGETQYFSQEKTNILLSNIGTQQNLSLLLNQFIQSGLSFGGFTESSITPYQHLHEEILYRTQFFKLKFIMSSQGQQLRLSKFRLQIRISPLSLFHFFGYFLCC